MDIGNILRSACQPASDAANRVAISIEGDGALTYRQLGELADRYANGLTTLGVGTGDRVGLLLHNCVEYVAAYFATVRLGAISVRLNFRLSEEELAYALNDSGCSVLLFHSGLVDSISGSRDQVRVRDYVCLEQDDHPGPSWSLPWSVLDQAPAVEPSAPLPAAEDAAMLMYTSGTTGRPKGALWSHGNTTWIAAMQAMKWPLGPSAVSLTSGPLYHVGAFEDLLLPTLMTQGEAVACRSTGFDIGRILGVLESRGVTDAFLYPFMISELLQHPTLPTRDLRALRRIITGGSALATWVVDRTSELLPGVELNSAFGLTEGGAISTVLDWRDLRRHPNSVGRPLPGTEVQIVDEVGGVLPVGADGEIWVRSPSVSAGYWNQPEATAATFVDGWCRTGDLGHLTPDGGLLMITGRKKDMIKSGGENIYPAEIELLLTGHEAIADCAVIAVPDEKLQEAVCAVVVPAAGATITPELVIDHCLLHLARYKRPRYVVIVDALPRNAAGKVLKVVLRERYANPVVVTPSQGDQPT